MKLLIALGNPGPEYLRTRHNVGWWAADALAHAHGFPAWQAKHKGLVTKGRLAGEDFLLLKPQTFMNLSGESAQAAAAFYKIDPKDIWVLHDELDVPVGEIRHKIGGSDAGHNGLRSLTKHLGTGNYHRIRIGIGRPVHKSDVSNYVLSNPTASEELTLTESLSYLLENLPNILEKPKANLYKPEPLIS